MTLCLPLLMTPAQKDSIKNLAKRWAWITTLGIPALGWGFRMYDATNVPAREFRAYRDSTEYRHTLDTLRAHYDAERIRAVVFHTDSVVRKICAAVQGGC